MEEIINKKGIKSGDRVKIVLPEGTKIGDNIGGYTILDSMFRANNSIVKVRKADAYDVFVEPQDLGSFWIDNSCVQPLLEYCTPQFKVGDSVVIKIPKEYDINTRIPFSLTKEMLGLNGICTKISKVEKAKYNKNDYSEISNLDGCKYYLEDDAYWIWPNCLLEKVEKESLTCKVEYDYTPLIAIDAVDQATSVDGCSSFSTYLTSERIKQFNELVTKYCEPVTKYSKQEESDLIKVKSKKITLNFKN